MNGNNISYLIKKQLGYSAFNSEKGGGKQFKIENKEKKQQKKLYFFRPLIYCTVSPWP